MNNKKLLYDYGVDGERIKGTWLNIDAQTQAETTYKEKLYLGSYEETKVGNDVTKQHYISSPTGLCAIIEIDAGGTSHTYATYTDHLGSLAVITDAGGTILERNSYDAWGRRRSGADWNVYETASTTHMFDRGYTMHEKLPEFGLINMNARLYDPILGRMLSPDPLVKDNTCTQGYNRYTYAGNNPVKFTDPTGKFIVAAIVIGAVIGAYIGGRIANGGEADPTNWNYNSGRTWGYMLGGAVIGGASGYLGASIAASGMPFANTAGILASSYSNSFGMHIMTNGQTDVSASFGAASYNFDSGEFGYLGNPNNSKMENIGYGFGALANIQDIVAGTNGISYRTLSRKKLWGHSEGKGSFNGKDAKISVGPNDQLNTNLSDSKWEMQYLQKQLEGNPIGGENVSYINESQGGYFSTTLNNVNGKALLGMSKNLNENCNLLGTGDLIYGAGFGCVNYTSRSLLFAGVINFNAFLPVTAPVLLNAELFARQMGIFASPYLTTNDF